ncbi:endo-1,4-beta-xylanase [Aurantimonas sp. A2-1-M11]|uniref:endo-1,4-beta-xylanase n=1 Tax=Aurantimonas sp. A2-1-M11 TaxID=3113712 RepID=UPI002F9588C9
MTIHHRGRDARSRPETGRPLDAAQPGDPSSTTAGSLTRRSLLGAGAALALAPGVAAAAGAPGSRQPRAVPLGGAIQAEFMAPDPAYRQAFLDHCDLIMPMNGLKFSLVHPQPDEWNFEPADRVIDFALENDRLTRGTCHVWWGATPDWLERLDTAAEVEAALVDHIERIGDRYKGRLSGWDVVNEVIANDPLTEGPLRRTTWMEKLGPNHIPIAFAAAARVDPDVRLVINDYDLEFVGPRYDARRQIMLDIVRQLQDGNIPVHGVGIQGHLYAGRQIDRGGLERFHKELDGLGVGLMVTELDVIDWETPPGDAAQDEAAYGLVSDLLDGIFAWKPPEAVIVWGISDRYSWVSDVLPRPDGHPDRPLPLDRDMRPKPWMSLLDQRLREG